MDLQSAINQGKYGNEAVKVYVPIWQDEDWYCFLFMTAWMFERAHEVGDWVLWHNVEPFMEIGGYQFMGVTSININIVNNQLIRFDGSSCSKEITLPGNQTATAVGIGGKAFKERFKRRGWEPPIMLRQHLSLQ